jgi:ribosome-associated protein
MPPIVLDSRGIQAPVPCKHICLVFLGVFVHNLNKVSSAVHLRFDVHASSLPEPIKARLLALRDHRITAAGVIVIKAQETRSQDMNRADALARLQALVDSVEKAPLVRRPTKPTYGSKQRRLEGKSVRSAIKAGRGKVEG